MIINNRSQNWYQNLMRRFWHAGNCYSGVSFTAFGSADANFLR